MHGLPQEGWNRPAGGEQRRPPVQGQPGSGDSLVLPVLPQGRGNPGVLREIELPMQGEAARVRSQTYWFLSGFFLERPDEDFLARLAQNIGAADSVSDPVYGPALAELAVAMRTTSPDRLAAEHTRLFGGVQPGYGPPPPFESVHRGERLLGDSTQDVLGH